MPNYVKNIITFENPEDFQTMVDLTISEKDDKTLFFDFNRVIRPPEELNITDSSAGSNGMDYLLNPQLFVEEKKDMLKIDISSEEAAIKTYTLHKKLIDDKYIKEMLDRIIMDEKRHLEIFNYLYDRLCKSNV